MAHRSATAHRSTKVMLGCSYSTGTAILHARAGNLHNSHFILQLPYTHLEERVQRCKAAVFNKQPYQHSAES